MDFNPIQTMKKLKTFEVKGGKESNKNIKNKIVNIPEVKVEEDQVIELEDENKKSDEMEQENIMKIINK